MAKNRKGVRSIRTMGGIADRRRVRTPAGALMEMSALANEKARLVMEVSRWRLRETQIKAQLSEIEERRRWLASFCEVPDAPTQADPVPTCLTHKRLRVRELRY